MSIGLVDRLVSAVSYFTFGFFSIIWLIFANVTKKNISKYLSFNLYQAIFLSIVLAILSLLYSIAINLLSVVPYIGTLARNFDLFFNQTPLYFSFSLSGLIVSILLFYLCILSLIGLKPYIPLVSDLINDNFRG